MQRIDDFVLRSGTPTCTARRRRARRSSTPRYPLQHHRARRHHDRRAAALAAFYLRMPVGHVEAGLRTRRPTPFPEEANRQLIADRRLPPRADRLWTAENLVREGVPDERIFVTGNTGIDALRWRRRRMPFSDQAVAASWVASRSSSSPPTAARTGAAASADRRGGRVWRRFASGVGFVVPLHPNPLAARAGRSRSRRARTSCCRPLDYAEFARLMGARTVITDSGGHPGGGAGLSGPVLVTRDSTERTEGLLAGTLSLVGTESTDRLRGDPVARRPAGAPRRSRATNPYGDARAADRIVAALEFLSRYRPRPQRVSDRRSHARGGCSRAAGYPIEVLTTPVEERGVPASQSGPR